MAAERLVEIDTRQIHGRRKRALERTDRASDIGAGHDVRAATIGGAGQQYGSPCAPTAYRQGERGDQHLLRVAVESLRDRGEDRLRGVGLDGRSQFRRGGGHIDRRIQRGGPEGRIGGRQDPLPRGQLGRVFTGVLEQSVRPTPERCAGRFQRNARDEVGEIGDQDAQGDVIGHQRVQDDPAQRLPLGAVDQHDPHHTGGRVQ
ncbi:hypothetical protein GCM10027262_73500 [Nocardia tengchongensis]